MNTRDPSLQNLTLPCLKHHIRPSEPTLLRILPLSVETSQFSRQLKFPFLRQLPLPIHPPTAAVLRPSLHRSSRCNKLAGPLQPHRMAQSSYLPQFLAKEKRINLDLLSNLRLVLNLFRYLNALSRPPNNLDHRTEPLARSLRRLLP